MPGFLGTQTVLELVLLLITGFNLSAAQTNQETSPTADAASEALFSAVRSGDEMALTRILGGGKELVSSNDAAQDRLDREMFARKYQEMHRLSRQSGSTFLYIGAENWPFPVPLVSKGGKWFFDADKGSQEVLFRRIGENETVVAEACHALAGGRMTDSASSVQDDPILQYTRSLMSSGVDSGSPFHGYFFRRLSGKKEGETVIFLAYPAEYRSSGVLTFVVSNGALYEADLGPNTSKIAKTMSSWKPGSTWHAADTQ